MSPCYLRTFYYSKGAMLTNVYCNRNIATYVERSLFLNFNNGNFNLFWAASHYFIVFLSVQSKKPAHCFESAQPDVQA